MANELRTMDNATIARLVLDGDMKGLSEKQKVEYYGYRCQQAGLDPAAKPFDILVLNGKMILYANASCTQQLTANRKLSHQVTNRELVDGIYCVFVRVTDPEGRSTENMGAVPVEGLKGDAKANAMLKATTKAIRRAVLAHCGLGILDETEVEAVPAASKAPVETIQAKVEHEWTAEEIETARQDLASAADALAEAGCPLDQVGEKIKAAALKIGDIELTPEKWGNRLCSMVERMIQKETQNAG